MESNGKVAKLESPPGELTVAHALIELSEVKESEDVDTGDTPAEPAQVDSLDTMDTIKVNQIPTMIDKETQFGCNTLDTLDLRVEEHAALQNDPELFHAETKSSSLKTGHMDVDQMRGNDRECRFYTGLSWLQLVALWNFLGPGKYKLTLWKSSLKNPELSLLKRPESGQNLSAINQLFVTLIRLRLGLLHQDIAYRFQVSTSYVSSCVITWVWFLYHEFSGLRATMFPPRETVSRNVPRCFKCHKNLRVILDITEFCVDSISNFQELGSMYSQYKAKTSFKALLGISPRGACVFVSEAYEASISDRQLTIDSRFLDKLNPGDLVMTDRDFTIGDLLVDYGATLKIPPSRGSTSKFTAQQEVDTKRIAKGRIYVERFMKRLKKYRIFGKTIPASLKPVFSQVLFVGCCLVNFQSCGNLV